MRVIQNKNYQIINNKNNTDRKKKKMLRQFLFKDQMSRRPINRIPNRKISPITQHTVSSVDRNIMMKYFQFYTRVNINYTNVFKYLGLFDTHVTFLFTREVWGGRGEGKSFVNVWGTVKLMNRCI